MARPRKRVDADKLRQLAALGLSTAEMAAILDCSADTLERRYKDELELGRQKRNASLRRKQFEVAMNGDKTMLIWLGKQFLGQRDKLEHSGSMDVQLGWVAKLSDEELEAQLKARGVNVGPQAAG